MSTSTPKRNTKTTPKRNTKTTPKRNTKTTPKRNTRTTPKRNTKTTPKRNTRTTTKRNTRTTPKRNIKQSSSSGMKLEETETKRRIEHLEPYKQVDCIYFRYISVLTVKPSSVRSFKPMLPYIDKINKLYKKALGKKKVPENKDVNRFIKLSNEYFQIIECYLFKQRIPKSILRKHMSGGSRTSGSDSSSSSDSNVEQNTIRIILNAIYSKIILIVNGMTGTIVVMLNDTVYDPKWHFKRAIEAYNTFSETLKLDFNGLKQNVEQFDKRMRGMINKDNLCFLDMITDFDTMSEVGVEAQKIKDGGKKVIESITEFYKIRKIRSSWIYKILTWKTELKLPPITTEITDVQKTISYAEKGVAGLSKKLMLAKQNIPVIENEGRKEEKDDGYIKFAQTKALDIVNNVKSFALDAFKTVSNVKKSIGFTKENVCFQPHTQQTMMTELKAIGSSINNFAQTNSHQNVSATLKQMESSTMCAVVVFGIILITNLRATYMALTGKKRKKKKKQKRVRKYRVVKRPLE
jgi:hypothetical protein